MSIVLTGFASEVLQLLRGDPQNVLQLQATLPEIETPALIVFCSDNNLHIGFDVACGDFVVDLLSRAWRTPRSLSRWHQPSSGSRP